MCSIVEYGSKFVDVQFSTASDKLVCSVVCIEVVKEGDDIRAAEGAEVVRQRPVKGEAHPTVVNNSGHATSSLPHVWRCVIDGLTPGHLYRLYIDVPEKQVKVSFMLFGAPPLAEEVKGLKRIAYWSGKVNQYVNEVTGEWRTTPGGNAGANIAQLGETHILEKYTSVVVVVVGSISNILIYRYR